MGSFVIVHNYCGEKGAVLRQPHRFLVVSLKASDRWCQNVGIG